MIIDDSETDQFFAKLEIEKFDPTVHIFQAFDGFQALEALAKAEISPDVIFLDINMPRMSGHEFLEKYVQDFKETAMVFMLSSSNLDIDKACALCYDCVRDYIEKPLDAAFLSRASAMLKNR